MAMEGRRLLTLWHSFSGWLLGVGTNELMYMDMDIGLRDESGMDDIVVGEIFNCFMWLVFFPYYIICIWYLVSC